MRFSRVSVRERIAELSLEAAAKHVNMPWLRVRVAGGGTCDIENVCDVFFGNSVWSKDSNSFA
jgi:hypothetical protein